MKLIEILKGVQILETNADLETNIESICSDSRTVTQKSLFIAVTGFAVDGHKFISGAIANGSIVVVCEKKPSVECNYVIVENSRREMSKISNNFYNSPSKEMKCIGITGTNGKTTTTYLVKHILQCFKNKVGLIGTNANYIGDKVLETERTTPESIELQALLRKMADENCTHVVMEVSSHSLVLDRVIDIDFAVGAFTNISQDHLDFHETMDEYAKAKSNLFKLCKKGSINIDDKYSSVMMSNALGTILSYGIENEKADLNAKNLDLRSDSVAFDLCYKDEVLHCTLNIPGKFTVYNALTAISVLLSLDYPLGEIVAALKTAEGVKGRVEVVKVHADYTVLIDYAHSEDGILNVLSSVKGYAKGRVIALFGCGGDRDRSKRPLMAKAATKYADFTIITSDNPRTEDPKDIINDILEGVINTEASYGVIVDRREAIRYALDNAKKDDIIVLMGKGHETYQEINGVKHHLDEREEISNYFINK